MNEPDFNSIFNSIESLIDSLRNKQSDMKNKDKCEQNLYPEDESLRDIVMLALVIELEKVIKKDRRTSPSMINTLYSILREEEDRVDV
jgi:hypothetical protein